MTTKCKKVAKTPFTMLGLVEENTDIGSESAVEKKYANMDHRTLSLNQLYTCRHTNSRPSVASPICQEGQSERIFPIFPLFPDFFPLFPDFLPLFFTIF